MNIYGVVKLTLIIRYLILAERAIALEKLRPRNRGSFSNALLERQRRFKVGFEEVEAEEVVDEVFGYTRPLVRLKYSTIGGVQASKEWHQLFGLV